MKRPQFLFTYYNPFDSHKDNLGNTFLDYVKDVNLANYSSQVVGKFIEQQTEEQLSAINNLSTELSMIGEDIRHGFNKIDQRLTLIQVEQFNTNLLLNDIKQILKQPDSEKQRMKHIELGVKFFNQSLKNEDLIIDAVEEFDKAFALMKQDWFTAYQLGLCHTFYQTVQDLSKAEAYFLNAAKYASVDTLVVNDFNEAFYKSISLTENKDNNLLDFAAECYLQVALIKYIQADFLGAVNYAKKATSISPSNAKAFFLLAKYQSRIGENLSAIESLKVASTLDVHIYKIFHDDIDIIKNSLFQDFYHQIGMKVLKKQEEEKQELIGKILFGIMEKEIFDRHQKYFLSENLVGIDNYKYPEVIALRSQSSEVNNYYPMNKNNSSLGNEKLEILKQTIIDKFNHTYSNNSLVKEFIVNIESKCESFLKKREKRSQNLLDELSKEYGGKPEKAPLSLIEDIKGNYSSRSLVYNIYENSNLKLNLIEQYTEELKNQNLFDKIKILGDTPQQKNICQLHFDCFLTGKSLITLPSPQELEREKSWWEKLFG